MKSERFTTPPAKSTVPSGMVDDEQVTFDNKTGNIMYKDGEKSWSLTEFGHCKQTEDVMSITGDGILTKGRPNEANGFFCYGPTEYPVKIKEADGTESERFIRLTITVGGKSALVAVNDGRLFLIEYNAEIISYDREINTVKINQAISLMNKFNAYIGDTTKLKSNKLTLVDTLNELIERVNCPRRLLGYVKFLIFTDEELEKFVPEDMDLCFNYQKKRFMYYSGALSKWTYLPIGWQKCTNIYRHELDMQFDDTSVLEVGETLGCLDTGKVYRWNGEIWTELANLTDDIGDEFIVQYALVAGQVKSLTVVKTGAGWVYTLR